MAALTLTPEQQRFVNEIIARGRYRDVSEVVRASLELLCRSEAERLIFIASLEEAEADGEREGFLASEDVYREMTSFIDAMVHSTA